jgi:diacylglycerol kinase family enzyme
LRDLEHTYLLLSHVSHLEATFPIAPNQSPLDSTVTVVEIGPMTAEGLMNVMQAVYGNSMHLGMPGVRFMEGVNDVSFTVEEEDARWRRICIDGDIITVEKGTEIGLKLRQGVEINGGVLTLSIAN